MKKIIVILIIFIAVLLGGFAFIVYRDRGMEVPASGDEMPSGDTFSETIPVPEGFPLWTEPLKSDQIPTEGDPMDRIDVSSLGEVLGDTAGSVIVVPSEAEEGFSIVYYDMDESVFIVLTRAPFRETRIRAEQEFLRKFGLTKAEACRLDVRLTIYARYDMTNYGLSFCPNGRPIPEG